MRLVVHIGTVKTGTTAFQTWLARNAEALRARGLWVPTSLGSGNPGNHTSVALAIRRPGVVDAEMRNHGITTVEEHRVRSARVLADLRGAVRSARSSGAATFLLSSEHLTFRVGDRNDLAVLDALVGPGDDVVVVMSVRPQVDHALLSLASTNARHGNPTDADWLEGVITSGTLDYPALLDPWRRCFGDAAIRVVPYVRRPVLSEVLAELTGVDISGLAEPRRVNTALDARVVAFTNHVASVGPRRTSNPYVKVLDDFPVAVRLSFGRAEAAEIAGRFAAGNAELCRQWSSIEPDDLRTDPDEHPEVGTFSELASLDFSPVTRHVTERLVGERWLGEAERDLARAQLRLLRFDITLARRLAAEAARKAGYVLDAPGVEERAARTRARGMALAEGRPADLLRTAFGRLRRRGRG